MPPFSFHNVQVPKVRPIGAVQALFTRPIFQALGIGAARNIIISVWLAKSQALANLFLKYLTLVLNDFHKSHQQNQFVRGGKAGMVKNRYHHQ